MLQSEKTLKSSPWTGSRSVGSARSARRLTFRGLAPRRYWCKQALSCRPDLGCIDADFCKQVFVFQHVSWSTRSDKICNILHRSDYKNISNMSSQFWYFWTILHIIRKLIHWYLIRISQNINSLSASCLLSFDENISKLILTNLFKNVLKTCSNLKNVKNRWASHW